MDGAVVATAVGALSSLVGVTLGALVEPLKLGAGERARTRRDRTERCAAYVEAATTARERLVEFNVLHRLRERSPDDARADPDKYLASTDAFYQARASMRQIFGLLVMSGPEELVEQAKRVRMAEMQLHAHRRAVNSDDASSGGLPAEVLAAVRAFDEAIEEFARAARKHAK
ncbi:hypothetical protein [Actinomadura decatromicini]|uniref:Uncharacterized protein n=1 Tax=Actinomadura decatromicini TaxID=2604572 RepID=A0A5D3FG47_9ACTN|nr:hypothetical protein [Actinomadura decatromicini]TYK47193.1 hypothetical protein FXF68_25690 [Actinomadura decatromicini]